MSEKINKPNIDQNLDALVNKGEENVHPITSKEIENLKNEKTNSFSKQVGQKMEEFVCRSPRIALEEIKNLKNHDEHDCMAQDTPKQKLNISFDSSHESENLSLSKKPMKLKMPTGLTKSMKSHISMVTHQTRKMQACLKLVDQIYQSLTHSDAHNPSERYSQILENVMDSWHRMFEDSFRRFFFDPQFGLIQTLETCYESEIKAKMNSEQSIEISKIPNFKKFMMDALSNRVILKHDSEIESIKKKIENCKTEVLRANRHYPGEKLGQGLHLSELKSDRSSTNPKSTKSSQRKNKPPKRGRPSLPPKNNPQELQTMKDKEKTNATHALNCGPVIEQKNHRDSYRSNQSLNTTQVEQEANEGHQIYPHIDQNTNLDTMHTHESCESELASIQTVTTEQTKKAIRLFADKPSIDKYSSYRTIQPNQPSITKVHTLDKILKKFGKRFSISGSGNCENSMGKSASSRKIVMPFLKKKNDFEIVEALEPPMELSIESKEHVIVEKSDLKLELESVNNYENEKKNSHRESHVDLPKSPESGINEKIVKSINEKIAEIGIENVQISPKRPKEEEEEILQEETERKECEIDTEKVLVKVETLKEFVMKEEIDIDKDEDTNEPSLKEQSLAGSLTPSPEIVSKSKFKSPAKPSNSPIVNLNKPTLVESIQQNKSLVNNIQKKSQNISNSKLFEYSAITNTGGKFDKSSTFQLTKSRNLASQLQEDSSQKKLQMSNLLELEEGRISEYSNESASTRHNETYTAGEQDHLTGLVLIKKSCHDKIESARKGSDEGFESVLEFQASQQIGMNSEIQTQMKKIGVSQIELNIKDSKEPELLEDDSSKEVIVKGQISEEFTNKSKEVNIKESEKLSSLVEETPELNNNQSNNTSIPQHGIETSSNPEDCHPSKQIKEEKESTDVTHYNVPAEPIIVKEEVTENSFSNKNASEVQEDKECSNVNLTGSIETNEESNQEVDPVKKLKAKLTALLHEGESSDDEEEEDGNKETIQRDESENRDKQADSKPYQKEMEEGNYSSNIITSGVLNLQSPENSKYSKEDPQTTNEEEAQESFRIKLLQINQTTNEEEAKGSFRINPKQAEPSKTTTYQREAREAIRQCTAVEDLMYLPGRLATLQKVVSAKRIGSGLKKSDTSQEKNRSNQGSGSRRIKSALKKRSPSPFHRRTPSGKKVVFNMDAVKTKEFSSVDKVNPGVQNLPPKNPGAVIPHSKLSPKKETKIKRGEFKSSSNCLMKINKEQFTSDSKNNLDFTKSPINALEAVQIKPQATQWSEEEVMESFRLTPDCQNLYNNENSSEIAKSGLIPVDDSGNYYALREDNLKNFFSGETSMNFNNSNYHQNQQGHYMGSIDRPDSRARPSDNFSMKEFSENDNDYEEEINKTSPSIKYSALQGIKDYALRKNDSPDSNMGQFEHTYKQKKVDYRHHRNNGDHNQSVRPVAHRHSRAASYQSQRSHSHRSIRICADKHPGARTSRSKSPNFTPSRKKHTLTYRTVIDTTKRNPLKEVKNIESKENQPSLDMKTFNFKDKFNLRARRYQWREDSKANALLGMKHSSKSKQHISKCFKNLTRMSKKSTSNLEKQSSSSSFRSKSKKEQFKGVTTRHLDFLNKTLGYGTNSIVSKYGRNNSVTRTTSTYGPSLNSRRNYAMNSTLNTGSITSRLKEIDEKIAQAKRTAFSRAGPLYSRHQRSSSLGYGISKYKNYV